MENNNQIDDHQKARIDAILNFWFEPDTNRNIEINPLSFKKWFASSPETDAEIAEKFKEDLAHLSEGKYDSWK